MADVNRQWLLRRRPTCNVTAGDFEYFEAAIPDSASLQPGELVLRNRMFLCAPTMRNWMEPPGNSLYPSIDLGAPVMAPAVCEVVASARAGVPVGMRVTALTSWQDYQLLAADHPVAPVPDGLNMIEAMTTYGLNARTAYFGLLRVGRPKAGETLVVSGAAGSTGSVAAQIGKIMGCRVIGIAGGAEKCAWLTESCGLDAAVDYRRDNVEEALRALCPDGIDIFYDNVGGDILQAAIENMAKFGRIVLCGQIATYTQGGPARGPDNMMRLIYGSVTMQGFLQADYEQETDGALAQLRQWVDQGLIVQRADVRSGFERIPETFGALFEGGNEGTLLAAIE